MQLGSRGPAHGCDNATAILLPIPCSHVSSLCVSRETTPSHSGVRCALAVFFGRPFMGKKLYVGNLAYGLGDSDLQRLFEPHGTVESAQVIMDRDTGGSKGFGFVEMGSDQEAQAAIAALNGSEVDGRALTVNEARPKPEGGGGRSG